MAAPKGNRFWEVRAKHGRDALFKDSKKLLESVNGYFGWCEENPWYRNEAVKGGEMAGEIIKVPTARPYTISGLCIYLGVNETFWRQFKGSETAKTEDFSSVITYAEEVIRTQKFEGAAVGAFNANIISRDLGLTDKQEVATVKKVYKVKITNGG